MKRAVLLAVDDEPDNLRLLQRLFAHFLPDCKILTASSAKEGLAVAVESDLDGLLIDVQMPGMDGITMCRRLKSDERTAHLPMMLVTAHAADAMLKKEGFEAGADDFLAKPIDNFELMAKVNVMLRIKRAEDELRATNAGLEQVVAERTLALRKSEERYRAVAEDTPVLIFRFLPSGEISYVNETYCKYFEKTSEDVVGSNFLSVIPRADRETVMDNILALTVESPTRSHEHLVLAPDGETRWQRWTNRAIFDAQGQIVACQSVGEDITERKRVETELEESRRRLRDLAARLQEVRENERKAIAREIHDEFGQALTSLRIDLSWQREHLPEDMEEFRARSESMIGRIDTIIDSVRALSARLRPPVLDDLGVVAAIEWYVEEFASRAEIACDLDLEADLADLNPEQETAVFRITQEALTNVARHAEADRVEISLHFVEGSLVLRVVDNGKGISDEQSSGAASLGLLGMRERAEVLGGSLRVGRLGQGGTEVALHLPIQAEGRSRRKAGRGS